MYSEYQYPVISQLDALFHEGEDVFADDKEEAFATCRSLIKSGTRRCDRTVKERGRGARALLRRYLRTWNECTGEESCAILREFIQASHCSATHQGRALYLFDRWKAALDEAEPNDDPAPSDTSSSLWSEGVNHYTFSRASSGQNQWTHRRSWSSEQPEPRRPTPSPAQPESSWRSLSSDRSEQADSPQATSPQATRSPPQRESEDALAELVANITIDEPALTDEVRVVGVGVAAVRRHGSVRDRSSFIREIYKYPTADDMNVGVVYIFKHRTITNLFKVGYTRWTARRRHSELDNCYGADTDVVHETAGGPFAGAFKAEKLAHRILEHQNLWVRRCEMCGKGHREWFVADERVIRNAVEVAETLLRLPAYEMSDGKMKLSRKADEFIKPMVFSVDRLADALATRREAKQTEVRLVPHQADGGAKVATSVTKDVAVTSIDVVPPEDAAAAAAEPQEEASPGGTRRRSNAGAKLGAWANKIKRVRERVLAPRSREATPDVEVGDAKPPAVNEELFVRLAYTVLPNEVKACYDGEAGGKPRAFADLRDMMRQYGREFGEGFREAMDGKDGEDTARAKA